MRKYIVLVCCLLLILSFVLDDYKPVEPQPLEFGYIPSTLAEGIEKDDIYNMWVSQIDLTRYIKNDFRVLGSFRMWITFIYDDDRFCSTYSYRLGDYHEAYGWKLYEKGVTTEGSTITIHMELRKFIFRIPCSVTITCDKQGNILYE